jgi:RNA methyltransferase, TrmH family
MRDPSVSKAKARLLRRLSDPKGRRREGLVLLEGYRAVETARDAGARFRFVLLASDASSPEAAAAEGLAAMGVEVVRAPRGEVVELADTESPQGILAVAEEPRAALPGGEEGRGGAEAEAGATGSGEGIGGSGEGKERVLVLDGVQDPGNVGTLIRAAAALGMDRVLSLTGTADPWGTKAVRASVGLVFRVPVHGIGIGEALEWLRARGLPLLVADAGGEDVRRAELPRGREGGFALLVGNEGAGPREESREAADAVVALPLAPGVESLNVAVAGALLMWALGPGLERPGRGTSAHLK